MKSGRRRGGVAIIVTVGAILFAGCAQSRTADGNGGRTEALAGDTGTAAGAGEETEVYTGADAAEGNLLEAGDCTDSPRPDKAQENGSQEERNALALSLEVNRGGVEILSSSGKEVTADYDSRYYAVEIEEAEGEWKVSISGRKAQMGETAWVKLYLPDTRRNMDVDVEEGDFSYHLPENCSDVIEVKVRDGNVGLISEAGYKDSAVFIDAEKREYMEYGDIICPDYFTATNEGVMYKDGTEANHISVLLTGYANVEFAEAEAK